MKGINHRDRREEVIEKNVSVFSIRISFKGDNREDNSICKLQV
jgi:hypothetical protein